MSFKPQTLSKPTASRAALSGTVSSVKVSSWSIAALVALVLMVALRPIVTEDLWWTLSHGRAVVDGHLAPNRFLLAGDSLSEAPWLLGVPFLLLFLFGGVFPLMALKVVAISGVAVHCWRHSTRLPEGVRLVVTASLVVAVQAGCEPTGAFWDVLGLMIALRGTRAVRGLSPVSEAFWLGVLSCVWSNFGTLSILICFPLATEALFRAGHNSAALQRRKWFLVWGAVLLGCCLTPRGPFTVWDSLRQLAPWLTESRAVLDQTPWRTLWGKPLNGLSLSWASLTLAVVCAMLRSKSASRSAWLLLVIVQCAGGWSAPSAVVLSVWLADRAVEFWNRDVRTMPLWLTRVSLPIAVRVACVRLACVSVGGMAAWGVGPLSDSRCGWGLSRQLEDREFAAALGITTHSGTAHCADILSAGMLAWSELPNLKAYLVPHRALLCGKLRDEVLLTRELETGWQQRHTRSDGTAGGWWLTLQSRQAVLVVTSAERTKLIRGLEATLWKPLSLDSPVIPFAMAGDPEFTPRIVRVLSQRELVDRGRWTYQVEPAAGNDRLLDILGLATQLPDIKTIVRQSGVLRAMNLPQAAMRVLTPVLSSPVVRAMPFDRSLDRELLACQIALADRRQLICGEVDEFRQAVLDRVIASGERSLPPRSSAVKAVPIAAAATRWAAAVDLYLQGNPSGAAELLVSHDPAMMTARASLLWEAGLPVEAHAVWSALVQQFPESRFALVGHHALDSADY